ncbi:DNA ligase D [Duganella sp. LX20W]|uniref:DNA ligase (ATP) n=1 Tax=Rugamonas brunnea TaxID=2758569 RepID=A0A7W2EN12_9BURK|nr:DNA ligase D [Rugamonas brunnea]MBA5635491.1 DNA ligase D [Rugamonas brunnea]
MADPLHHYRSKRDFSKTPEPADGGEGGDALSFVVQKHWASHLHYDFRLELDGVLKSWAVPKGPSYDPHVKRMAIEVEDHPLAYGGFEGTIPEGEYGAGEVIVWDRGSWLPLGEPHAGYAKGHLSFELHGQKLRGKWALVRMRRGEQRQTAWLLIKEHDDYARPESEFDVVEQLPDSVLARPSGRGAKRAGRAAPAASSQAKAALSAASGQGNPALPDQLPAGVRKAALPDKLAPQLATLAEQPPATAGDWIYETKFDGYRLLSRVDGDAVRLTTRSGADWTAKLGPLHAVLRDMHLPPGWYDGEIVVPDAQGRPDFGLLQQAFDGKHTADIIYYLFDLPYCGGYDLRHVPLEQRRALLEHVLDACGPSSRVRFSPALDAAPERAVEAACRLGLEGIIGKRRDAPYVSHRTRDWIKLKCGQRQEFVVGGYTDPQGSRSGFGSLLLGVYDEHGRLHYAGNVGTGFDAAELKTLSARMRKLAVDDSPFDDAGRVAGRPHWLRPELVAEVSFGEWTRDGSLRHSVFHGLREDKPARAIRREDVRRPAPGHDDDADPGGANVRGGGRASAGASASARMAPPDPPAVASKLPARLHVTHPDRVVDRLSGTTKLALVRYYAQVAVLMQPHLKERPVALLRAPDGVEGELFFQKHAGGRMAGVRELDQALDPDHPPMLTIDGAAGLLSAAQWNVVEIHTQNALARTYDHPNRLVFDLDPGQGVTWPQVREAALLVRSMLDELELPAFLKTSGGKGLHLVVPLRPHYGWDDVKGFSQAVVAHIARLIPERFSAKSGPRNRVGRIYIDYLRNGRGATTVCAWSARARPGLGISVPVEWDELERLDGGDHWTVRTIEQRLDVGNAPWKDYARSARGLAGPMRRLGYAPDGTGEAED